MGSAREDLIAHLRSKEKPSKAKTTRMAAPNEPFKFKPMNIQSPHQFAETRTETKPAAKPAGPKGVMPDVDWAFR